MFNIMLQFQIQAIPKKNKQESKVFYEVSSLQPRFNRLTDGPFENVIGIPDDSFKFADNLKLDKGLLVVLLLLVVLFLIRSIFMCFWKTKEPIKSDRKLNNIVRPLLSPKKKKTRKAVNMKSSAVTATNDNIVASTNHNAKTNEHSSIQNCDTNLMNLSSHGTNEGRCVGKLFVSNTEIGRGSNGTVVFEGIYDGRAVAVKRLLRAHHDIALKEIKNLIACDRHHNIVRWYGLEQDMDFVYISLERCIFSLSDLIQLDTTYHIPTKTDNYMTSSYTKEHKFILHNINVKGRDIQLWRSNGLPSLQLLKLMRLV